MIRFIKDFVNDEEDLGLFEAFVLFVGIVIILDILGVIFNG